MDRMRVAPCLLAAVPAAVLAAVLATSSLLWDPLPTGPAQAGVERAPSGGLGWGEGVHDLRTRVTGGSLSIVRRWSVEVDRNRPPTVRMAGPSPFTEGVVLWAEAEDPDGDDLALSWLVDGLAAGNGTLLNLTLEAGGPLITPLAGDGRDATSVDRTVAVWEDMAPEPGDEGPGFAAGSTAAALIMAMAVVGVLLRSTGGRR